MTLIDTKNKNASYTSETNTISYQLHLKKKKDVGRKKDLKEVFYRI